MPGRPGNGRLPGCRTAGDARRVERQPVAEKSRAAVFPLARKRGDRGRLHTVFRQAAAALGQGPATASRDGARVVPPATVRRGAHIGHDAVLMPSYVNIGAYVGPAPWSTPGPRWVPAPRSAPTFTCPAGWVSGACSSHCRPTPPSSRTTVSSAPVPKWSKA